MAAYDGSIKIDTKIDTGGFNVGIEKMAGAVKGLAAAMAAAFGVSIGVKGVVAIAKLSSEFTRLGLAAQAVGQLYNRTVEETQAVVGGLVDLGIQTDVANKAFINFAREGLDTGLLPALARGAQDLNVFAESGASSSEVLDQLMHGVLTLNPLILRNAGVAVDLDKAYRDFAASAGISVSAMGTQEKRQAALVAVTEKLRGVTGLYELSQKSLAGQMSSNKRIMAEFQAAMGLPFQDALYILVRGFNSLVKAFTAAIQPGGMLYGVIVNLGAVLSVVAGAVGRLFSAIASLFGVKTQSAAATTAQAVGGVAKSTDAASQAQGGLAKSLKKTEKAAKGALAAFDMLNVLQQENADTPDEPTGGGGGALGDLEDMGGAGALGTLDPSLFTDPLEAIRTKADEMRASLADFFSPLTDSFDRLVEALRPLGETIWSGLVWVWENVLVPLGNWTVSELLPAFLDALTAGVELLNPALEALRPLWDWIWENMLKPAGTFVGDALLNYLEWATNNLKELNKWIKENQTAFQVIMAIIAIAAVVILALTSPIAAVTIAIIAVIAIIKNWGAIWDWIVQKLTYAWETIRLLFEIGKIIVQAGVKAIQDNFYTMLDNVKARFVTIFDGISQIVKGAANSIIDIINSLISRIVTGINTIVTTANTVGGAIPGFSPLPLVAAPKIPKLAQGAVIPPNSEFLAMLGDQRSGRNIEAPESLIRQIVREESGGASDITIRFEGTLAALVRELKPVLDRENARQGASLIVGA